MTSPFTCRWGICATGWISTQFSTDLLVHPKTRGVEDVQHKIVAVASRSKENAENFVSKLEIGGGDEEVKTYGSYQDLYNDQVSLLHFLFTSMPSTSCSHNVHPDGSFTPSQNVDAVYVGTPHSEHYRNVFEALTAGKNVLVEKPMTVNAMQSQTLVDLARKKQVFLMEAVWTRFQPYSYKLQEVLKSGVLGEIRSASAELCVDFGETAKRDPAHRLVNPELAGGALLDLGPYPWTQLCLALGPPSKVTHDRLSPLKISASMTKTTSVLFPLPLHRSH